MIADQINCLVSCRLSQGDSNLNATCKTFVKFRPFSNSLQALFPSKSEWEVMFDVNNRLHPSQLFHTSTHFEKYTKGISEKHLLDKNFLSMKLGLFLKSNAQFTLYVCVA